VTIISTGPKQGNRLMQDYQREFLDLAIERGALCFGEYTLKSGRISPYFFNAGLFNSGHALARLGRCYAQAIVASKISFDMLFGPAYKGIPLAVATAIALSERHDRNLPWCFNRKEMKAHGEGGSTVGAPLRGRVLIIDDVISAGTAVREALKLLHAQEAKPAGVVVALDRQERGQEQLSALQELEHLYHIPAVSIVHLDELLAYLEGKPAFMQQFQAVRAYRTRYGV
jgi:orotate phosphoribosyltransferase